MKFLFLQFWVPYFEFSVWNVQESCIQHLFHCWLSRKQRVLASQERRFAPVKGIMPHWRTWQHWRLLPHCASESFYTTSAADPHCASESFYITSAADGFRLKVSKRTTATTTTTTTTTTCWWRNSCQKYSCSKSWISQGNSWGKIKGIEKGIQESSKRSTASNTVLMVNDEVYSLLTWILSFLGDRYLHTSIIIYMIHISYCIFVKDNTYIYIYMYVYYV